MIPSDALSSFPFPSQDMFYLSLFHIASASSYPQEGSHLPATKIIHIIFCFFSCLKNYNFLLTKLLLMHCLVSVHRYLQLVCALGFLSCTPQGPEVFVSWSSVADCSPLSMCQLGFQPLSHVLPGICVRKESNFTRAIPLAWFLVSKPFMIF